jgi:hypothetical protein
MKIRKSSWVGVAMAAMLSVFSFAAVASAELSIDTESRLQALEQELYNLKAEQAETQKEALAQRDQAPVIGWRGGRGMNIRGGDGSWAFNISMINQTWVSFFPDSDSRSACTTELSRTPTISQTSPGTSTTTVPPRPVPGGRLQSRNSASFDCDDRAGQFSMTLRRLRPGFTFMMDDGLYEFGFTIRMETAPDFNFNGGGASINLNKFSPYYPRVQLLSIQAMNNPSGTKMSSTTGLSLDRSLLVGSTLRDGNGKGYGVEWVDVPFLAGKIESLSLAMSSGNQFTSKTAPDPIDQKGVSAGIIVNPFSDQKGSFLQGLRLGYAYFHDFLDVKRASRLSTTALSTRGNSNSTTFFAHGTNGKRTWWVPNMGFNLGPYRLDASYDHVEFERDFSGDPLTVESGSQNCTGTPSPTDSGNVGCGPNTGLVRLLKLGDAKITSFVIRNGIFLWGNERGGLRISHTFDRVDTDSGPQPAAPTAFERRNLDQVVNSFPDMRRNHVIKNSLMLRWFQKANMIWSLAYERHDFNKMYSCPGGVATLAADGTCAVSGSARSRPSDSALDAQRRLGIGEKGGEYSEIIFAHHWLF